MSTRTTEFVPALPLLQLTEEGEPWLAGSRCADCKAVFTGSRVVCASCGGRGTLAPTRLSERGTLYSYSVVHRSFPGVATPFISAVVDLEGGGALRGTLLDVAPEGGRIPYDLPVRVIFKDTGQTTKEGRRFLSYYFVPATENPA